MNHTLAISSPFVDPTCTKPSLSAAAAAAAIPYLVIEGYADPADLKRHAMVVRKRGMNQLVVNGAIAAQIYDHDQVMHSLYRRLIVQAAAWAGWRLVREVETVAKGSIEVVSLGAFTLAQRVQALGGVVGEHGFVGGVAPGWVTALDGRRGADILEPGLGPWMTTRAAAADNASQEAAAATAERLLSRSEIAALNSRRSRRGAVLSAVTSSPMGLIDEVEGRGRPRQRSASPSIG